MRRSGKLFIASGIALVATLAVFCGSFLTDGFGPCGSTAGVYCLLALFFFLGVTGLLLVIAVAQTIVEHIRT